jgi:hypothetical protein
MIKNKEYYMVGLIFNYMLASLIGKIIGDEQLLMS